MNIEEYKTELEVMRDSIRELKKEYEDITETLHKQYKNLAPQSYQRKYVGGHYDALTKVVKDLGELLK